MKKEDGSFATESTYTQCDKLRALELLGKKLKLFTDKLEVENAQDAVFRMMLQKMKEEEQAE